MAGISYDDFLLFLLQEAVHVEGKDFGYKKPGGCVCVYKGHGRAKAF